MSSNSPNTPSPDDLLTTAEAAALLRTSTSSIRRWIESGDLVAIRLPRGVYRIRRREVDRLLARLSTED